MGKKEESYQRKFERWRRILQRAYGRFLKIRGRPREIALGFSLGLFLGILPILGVQIILSVFFAALFKWNKLSAVVGVWITNPLTAPFVYGITYLVGARLLGTGNHFPVNGEQGFSMIHDILIKAPEVLWAMMVGGIVLGLPVAVLGYYMSHSLVSRYQEGIRVKLARRRALLRERRARRKQARLEKKR